MESWKLLSQHQCTHMLRAHGDPNFGFLFDVLHDVMHRHGFLMENTCILLFQIAQVTSMVKEAIAFRLGVCGADMFVHQDLIFLSPDQRDMSMVASPIHALTNLQILAVKQHPKKRCVVVSFALLHRGQLP